MTAFRRLVAAYPDSIGAGDIARGCKVPQNTMSTHLAILTRAGLLHVERDGRQMNYQADLDGFRAVVMYLAKDCCDGRSDLCASLVADLALGSPDQERRSQGFGAIRRSQACGKIATMTVRGENFLSVTIYHNPDCGTLRAALLYAKRS